MIGKAWHAGAERSVNCAHLQALLSNTQQRHWEWQENRRTDWVPLFFRYRTAFMASLDVKTGFDGGHTGTWWQLCWVR